MKIYPENKLNNIETIFSYQSTAFYNKRNFTISIVIEIFKKNKKITT